MPYIVLDLSTLLGILPGILPVGIPVQTNNNNLRWADLKISIAAKLDRDEAKCARYHQVAVQ